jgi:hypothetical protein
LIDTQIRKHFVKFIYYFAGLPKFGPLPTYSVSDTYPIRVRVWSACDTHPILQLAYQSILTIHRQYIPNTPRYAPIRRQYIPNTPLIRLRYAPDTPMIFFSRYFSGFGQEYTPNTRRYTPILLRYVPEWNLYHVFCVAIAFQLFIYQ